MESIDKMVGALEQAYFLPMLIFVELSTDPRARIADSADAAGWWSHEAGRWDSVHTRSHIKRGNSHEVTPVSASENPSLSAHKYV